MNISLPPALRSWVERQVEARGYSTASEFVRDMIRREREKSVQAHVDRALSEAIQSPITPMTDHDWSDIAKQGKKRVAERGKK